jgi:ribosomal protein L10
VAGTVTAGGTLTEEATEEATDEIKDELFKGEAVLVASVEDGTAVDDGG